MGWGESLWTPKRSSKSLSRLHLGADKARCERGLVGSFKHRQRAVPAVALGLRPTAAHLAP